MDKKLKQYLIIACVAVTLYAALMNLGDVFGFLGTVIRLVMPVIVGGILALFLNVPVNGFEKILNKIFSKAKKPLKPNLVRSLSFILALLCIVLILVLVMTLLVPEIITSSKSLYVQIEKRIAYISSLDITVEWLDKLVSEINFERFMKGLSNGANILLTNVVGVVSSTVSIVITTAFAIIISIYMTLSKDKLCYHSRAVAKAYLKPTWAEFLFKFSRMFSVSFSKFLSGQCTEALILGTLMFFAFLIFKLPYGLLVGLLTAVCAIIPYIGAFVSCAISVFLILIIDPSLAIRCIIVYLVVQFIENQFIYPKVVGDSVGLSPLYTLIAALIGGNLFGIVGIIFFIPLAAVLLELVKESTDKRLAMLNLSVTDDQTETTE